VNFANAPKLWLRLGLFLIALLGLAVPSAASVEISFYSREMNGDNFPHAFVALRGTVDGTGAPVDTSFGFTAKAITPAILFGSVGGQVVVEGANQIARSDRQFSIVLTDAQYGAALAVIERWRNRPQPSYNMNRRNCVHFVGEIAQAIGLKVEFPSRLMKKPRSYLQHLRALNPQLATARAP
jgi:hypothetical protein